MILAATQYNLFLQPCIYHKQNNWRKGNQSYIFTHVAKQSKSQNFYLLSTYFKHSDYLLMPCTLIILHLDAPRDHNSRPKYVNCVQSCFANLYQNPMKDRTKKISQFIYIQNSNLIPTCFKLAAFGGPFSQLALWVPEYENSA